VKYTNSQKVLLVLDRYLLPLLLPFLRFPPSLTLSSLSSSFVGMTSIFFTISRITDREGKRVQRVGMRQASHRLKRIVAPARANANDKI
jgi:hypothetical protein